MVKNAQKMIVSEKVLTKKFFLSYDDGRAHKASTLDECG